MTSTDEPCDTNRRRMRSVVWEHFKRIENEGKAECLYCRALIGCSTTQGTNGMRNHLSRCKQYPYDNMEKRQKSDSGQILGASSSSSFGPWKFDQETSRKTLAAMFIIGELPFKFVENRGFRQFVSRIQPKFLIPSRNTLREDCYKLYLEERSKLKKYFSDTSPRICLTTDTWTSCQNLSYMCLTAHFIDADWRLQKKVLNFCQIPRHSAETIGKAVEKCLIGWGIKSIFFSLTVDNASSNDLGVQYLKKRLNSWSTLILAGELLHVRCYVHILSLIVRDGLKDLDDSIIRIRSVVRYVRSSNVRMQRFKECIELENIECRSLVSLDVETHWNSTYIMLEVALKFEKTFILLDIQDRRFAEELSKVKGIPISDDWEYAHRFLPFLKLFYDTTLKVYGSSYVTSNDMVKDVYGVLMMIDNYCENEDEGLQEMTKRMKTKFNKYFGNVNNINVTGFITCILDPRHKLEYVKWMIGHVYESKQVEALRGKVTSTLTSMFEQYRTGISKKNTRMMNVSTSPVVGADIIIAMYLSQTGREYLEEKSELDKYLEERCVSYSAEFDILNWWKVNSSRYLILSSIARNILAVPISTVASKAAFSTRGRVLDIFPSSLTPSMVEALVCTHDWLRSIPLSSSIEEDLEELENFEYELSPMNVELNSIVVSLDD